MRNDEKAMAAGTMWSWWVGRPSGAGPENESLVLLPTADIDILAAQHRAFECSTWGELRALEPDVYEAVLSMTAQDAAGAPSNDTPFDAEELGPVADGDWPESCMSLMNERLPESLVKQFGRRWATTLNGDVAALRPEAREDVLAEVRAAGASVREDPRIAGLLERDGWGVAW